MFNNSHLKTASKRQVRHLFRLFLTYLVFHTFTSLSVEKTFKRKKSKLHEEQTNYFRLCSPGSFICAVYSYVFRPVN